MEKIEIGTPGIKRALKNYTPEEAIAEYIWNGFDAKATQVHLTYACDEMGNVTSISVGDNGLGIPHYDLALKFKPFLQSDKKFLAEQKKNNSLFHGKNGVGRLTFFHFATEAVWNTVYKVSDNRFSYSIKIEQNALHTFEISNKVISDAPVGTVVTFKPLSINVGTIQKKILPFLCRAFGWLLELNKNNGFLIKINGTDLDYSALIGDEAFSSWCIDTINFDVKYVRWNESINGEYSRYYYLTSNYKEKHKEATTLNNKADHFYHSVFVTSALFDHDTYNLFSENNDPSQPSMFTNPKGKKIFKEFKEKIEVFLRDKRRPFLRAFSDDLIQDYENNGAFPKFGTNLWDVYKKNQLIEVIRNLYQIEPKLFNDLNTEQKKTFVHLLNLIMDSDERESLFNIMEGIVKLDTSEREELVQLLKVTTMSNIIKTIKLIEDRFRAIAELKTLVFDESFKANERDHIQKFVENHYWLFGEQYHLVAAAEVKFEEALRRYIHLLTNENNKPTVAHPDKNKEMDIFLVRQLQSSDTIHNIVVELKSPRVSLGEDQLSQVKMYMRVILSQADFNASNMTWAFYLIGNKLSSDGYIKGELENSKQHGEKSLVFFADRYKIYVKTWSEIFAEVELRHNFIMDRLKLQKEKLTISSESANKIIDNIDKNTARLPGQIKV